MRGGLVSFLALLCFERALKEDLLDLHGGRGGGGCLCLDVKEKKRTEGWSWWGCVVTA